MPVNQKPSVINAAVEAEVFTPLRRCIGRRRRNEERRRTVGKGIAFSFPLPFGMLNQRLPGKPLIERFKQSKLSLAAVGAGVKPRMANFGIVKYH